VEGIGEVVADADGFLVAVLDVPAVFVAGDGDAEVCGFLAYAQFLVAGCFVKVNGSG
jgi:hypothetical protein